MSGRSKALLALIVVLVLAGLVILPSCTEKRYYLGFNLDGVNSIRYRIRLIVELENTTSGKWFNTTDEAYVEFRFTKDVGRSWKVNAISSSADVAGPNATFHVDPYGNVFHAEFEAPKIECLDESGYGYSYGFGEFPPLPAKRMAIPGNWSATAHLNYTIKTPGLLTHVVGTEVYRVHAREILVVRSPMGNVTAALVNVNQSFVYVADTFTNARTLEDARRYGRKWGSWERNGTCFSKLVVDLHTGIVLSGSTICTETGSSTKSISEITLVDVSLEPH